MCEVKEDSQLQELMESDEYDFRYDIGISQPVRSMSVGGKNKIISLMSKHFCILRVKAELDQMLCGLSSTLNVLELIRDNCQQMRPLFLYDSRPPLSWENLYNLLPARMSVDGANKREREEAVMMRWIRLTQIVEGQLTMHYLISCLPRPSGER